jgi:hypothetical protein
MFHKEDAARMSARNELRQQTRTRGVHALLLYLRRLHTKGGQSQTLIFKKDILARMHS